MNGENNLTEHTLSAKYIGAETVSKVPENVVGLGWFTILLGMALICIGTIGTEWDKNQGVGLLLIGSGLIFVLLGIWCVGGTSKVAFNKPLGYITITKGYFPIFLWFLRIRRISREEASTVFVNRIESKFLTVTQTAYQVKVLTMSGEEMTLYRDVNEVVANRLAKRILEFGKLESWG